jgi:Lrp/AsnC family transcriptional regulator for asnA, asnC and gidA
MQRATSGLDDLDYAILAQLQEDGRRPFTDIAEALGVTSSTIKNRYRRMVDDGILVVSGFINPYRVGFGAPVIVLVKVRPTYLQRAAEAIAEFPEVDYIAVTSGEFDLDLTVSCRDHEHLLSFVEGRLHGVEGVLETRTKMILRVVKYKQANVSMLRSLALEAQERSTVAGPGD